MTRYFLHLRCPDGDVIDQEGIHRESMADLRATVLANARDVIAADVRDGMLDLRARIDVEDTDGVALFSLRFVDAVTIVSQRPDTTSFTTNMG